MVKKQFFLLGALLSFININADQAQDLNLKGLNFCTQEKWSEAMDCFKQATECDSEYPSAWNNLAVARYRNFDLDGAIEAVKKSLELNTLDPEMHYNLGAFLMEKHDLPAAEQAFLRAINVSPKFHKALYSLGMLKMRTKTSVDAYDFLKAACEANPNEQYLVSFGQACMATGKVGESLEVYKKAAEMNPSRTNMFNLANSYYLTENFKGALEIYSELVKMDKNDPRYWYNMAETCCKVNDNAGALKAYLQAKNLQPSLPELDAKIDSCLNALNSKK